MPADRPEAAPERRDGSFLPMKRGLHHRPEGKGYTGLKRQAGRWTFAEAVAASGAETTMRHEDEAPEFAPACYHDVKEAALLAAERTARETAEAQLAAIRADRPFVMGFNVGYEAGLRQAMEAVEAQRGSRASYAGRGALTAARLAIAALLPQPEAQRQAGEGA